MSEVFLNVPEIGRLYFKETLVEYDFPLIFICEDDYDSLYLFYETEEADEFMEWQTVKITRQTYQIFSPTRFHSSMYSDQSKCLLFFL